MIDFLYNPQGRISRKGYAVAFLIPMLVLTRLVAPVLAASGLGVVAVLIGLFYLWPSNLATPVKRFHDIGVTGWYQAAFFGLHFLAAIVIVQGIGVDAFADGSSELFSRLMEGDFTAIAETADPGRTKLGFALTVLVSVGQTVLFLAAPGQRKANRFGNDPLASGRGFAD